MSDDQDVKRWLHGALTDEPPLRLDRDEVFREGRRKLRNRKLLQAGGTMTGVVAAAVGAVLLSGLVTEDPALPPASSSTHEKPPVSSTTHPTDPPSSAPTTTTEPPPPSTYQPADARAVQLTEAVVQSGLLPQGATLAPLPGQTEDPMFLPIHEGVYRMEADLRGPKDLGWVSVLVETAGPNGGLGATCEIPVTQFEHCKVRTEQGIPMTVAVQKLENGEVRNWVRAVRPDGTFVTAISSNLSEGDRAKGKYPTYDLEPPVSQQNLIAIAALPALGPS